MEQVWDTYLAPGEARETTLWYGGGTFLVLLTSWALTLAATKGLDSVLGAEPRVKHVPPPTSKDIGMAWVRLVTSWCFVLPLALGFGPGFRRFFLDDEELPVWWQAVFAGVVSMLFHDIFCLLDRLTFNLEMRLHRMVREVPKPLKGPLVWGGVFVHPSEIMFHLLDGVAGPVVYSLFWEPLPIRVWWIWLALLQCLWVIQRSNYTLPNPVDWIVSKLPEKKTKKKAERAEKARMAAQTVARERAMKKTS